jgi:hypothetical protein
MALVNLAEYEAKREAGRKAGRGKGRDLDRARYAATNLLHAGRAEQISAEARMADRAVADDIDERGLASPQCTFEGGPKLLRPLDVLTVTVHELEHPVVALLR